MCERERTLRAHINTLIRIFLQNLQELQSAEIDSSASRTNIESVLMPSIPSYIRFLAGPTAAPHWQIARAVSPDLQDAADEKQHTKDAGDASSTSDHEHHKVSRGFSASRTDCKESTRPPRRQPLAVVVYEDAGGVPNNHHVNNKSTIRRISSASHSRPEDAARECMEMEKESIHKKEKEQRRSLSAHPKNATSSYSNAKHNASCVKHKSEVLRTKRGSWKALRPITAEVKSPIRRAESNKYAWAKHVSRMRPVSAALKKLDHLQEYRESLPTVTKPFKTDPER